MGNFISYYMTSSLSPLEKYNYIHLSDVENHNLRPFDVETQTDKINFLDHEKESEVGFSILIPKHYNLFIYIDSLSEELKNLYVNAANKHNLIVDNYLQALANYEPFMEKYCFLTLRQKII